MAKTREALHAVARKNELTSRRLLLLINCEKIAVPGFSETQYFGFANSVVGGAKEQPQITVFFLS